ncbi:hypothetical protein RN001_006319 [Aquatica leii]|uniref:Regulatory protein zeste n=1 Tax=Aquatica leii TaxID=1421715 RepID=A0AAN7P7S1_9COLE|nr:hypothetical protein RN001_006319 [Aquatica leii]
MENDYIFKSNTIDPTVNAGYLINKWQDLTLKLNAIENGPALTVEEWRKRFVDWKYATISKYRKIKAHSKKNGSGPKLNIEMTSLEERGLSVCGKVTVMGAKVTSYEGLEPLSALAETLIKISESSAVTNNELLKTIKTFCDQYVEIKKDKIVLEKEKLKFEITKFKFLNEGFHF